MHIGTRAVNCGVYGEGGRVDRFIALDDFANFVHENEV
jgi:hypothetical protein